MLVLVAILVGMPLLAVPQIHERLFPTPIAELGRSAARSAARHAHAPALAAATEARPHALVPEAPRVLLGSPPTRTINSTDARPAESPPPSSAMPANATSTQVAVDLAPQAEQRLRELGASYLMVEQLEPSGLYRCLCLVDVPGTVYQRPFEAEDLVPEQALRRVLSEVEHWAVARQSAASDRSYPPPADRNARPSPGEVRHAAATGRTGP